MWAALLFSSLSCCGVLRAMSSVLSLFGCVAVLCWVVRICLIRRLYVRVLVCVCVLCCGPSESAACRLTQQSDSVSADCAAASAAARGTGHRFRDGQTRTATTQRQQEASAARKQHCTKRGTDPTLSRGPRSDETRRTPPTPREEKGREQWGTE